MDQLKKVAKGGLLLLGGDGLNAFWAYLFLLLASRLLGPELLGAYYWATAIIMFFAYIALVGLPQAMSYFVPRYEAKHAGSSRDLLSFSVLVVFFLSGLFAFLIFILSPQICGMFHRPGLAPLLRLFSLALPAMASMPLLLRYLVARFDVLPSVIIEDGIKGAVRILFLLAILAFGVKYYALAGADLAAYMILALLTLLYIAKRHGFGRGRLIDNAEKQRVIFYAMPFIAFYLLRLDSLFSMLLAYFLDLSDVAIFNVALRIALLGNYLYVALITMFAPVTSKLVSENKWPELRSNFRSVTRWLFIGSLPIFCLTIMYPAAWLGLFGPEFAAGGACLVILAVGLFSNYATSANSAIIAMSGRSWLNLSYLLMMALLSLSAGLVLVPRYGLVGGAWAFAAGIVFVNLVRLCKAWHIVGGGPYTWYLLKPIAATLFAGLLVGWLFPVGSRLTFGWLAVAALGYLTVYGALIILLGITREDKAMLREAYLKFRPEWLRSQEYNG